jgi:hypothetical protein
MATGAMSKDYPVPGPDFGNPDRSGRDSAHAQPVSLTMTFQTGSYFSDLP